MWVAAPMAAALMVGCTGSGPPPYEWDLPPGFPEPRVPEDNPMSAAKVELGRFLFYDVRLSGNQTQSCASCHRQSLAFTDGAPVSTGSTGEQTPRGSMSLANIAYAPRRTWANPLLSHLEQQAMIPMFGEAPVELGLAGLEQELLQRLSRDPAYPEMFREAFPSEADPITLGNVVKAIASFERTLISGHSAYDRYTYQGDDAAMTPGALRALDVFVTERYECFHCHQPGFAWTDSIDHTGLPEPQFGFHNTGLYNVGGRGDYPAPNRGVFEITGMRSDMGRFRSPTLRNIAVTAPYFHDGSAASLDEVIDHYAAGGRTIADGPYAGDGSESPLKNLFVRGFTLGAQDRQDLHELLESLTDPQFLTDPRFADPFE
ncbi:MAG: di-heme enzyme [Sandaracinaceae bacterium]|nr:di-heme enzyme [Sandaracinaceae bacterium]